jgi:hypothetical protein
MAGFRGAFTDRVKHAEFKRDWPIRSATVLEKTKVPGWLSASKVADLRIERFAESCERKLR